MPFIRSRSILRLPDRSLLWAVNKRGMGQSGEVATETLGTPGGTPDYSSGETAYNVAPTVIDAKTNQPVDAQTQSLYQQLWTSGLLSSFGKSAPMAPQQQKPGWLMPVLVGGGTLLLLTAFGGRR